MPRVTRKEQGFPVGFHKPHVRFTEDRQRKFLVAYAETGMVLRSALTAGVCSKTILNECKRNETFAALYGDAKTFFNELIDTEIKRRAIDGWDEPVYQKGERVWEETFDPETGKILKDKDGKSVMHPAVVKRFSDRLLEMMAKKNNPAYRDKQQIDVNISGGVLAIPSNGPQTTADWEKQYGEQTLEAEFERADPEERAPAQDQRAPDHPDGPCCAEYCDQCRPETEPEKPSREIKRGY